MKTRQYKNEKDWNSMKNLIIMNYSIPEMRLTPSACDLDFWRYGSDNSFKIDQIQLWEDECNNLLGFVWIDFDTGDTDLVSHNKHRNIENEMLEWSENEIMSKSKKKCSDRALFIHSFECDRDRIITLKNRGYKKTDIYAYYGKKNLGQEVPVTRLPAGYYIRNIQDSKEAEGRAPLNALAGVKVSTKQYIQMMKHAKSYQKKLDLICHTNENTIVACCTAWVDTTNRVGIIEPYACDPKHQKKGLMKNLLYEIMKRLQKQNVTEVYVSHFNMNVNDDYSDPKIINNDPAIATNKSVGFEPLSLNCLWKKKI